MWANLYLQMDYFIRLTFILYILVLLGGCSDKQTEDRIRLCKGAGVSEQLVKECGRSWEDYNRIMLPVRERAEREEVESFNAALGALPSYSSSLHTYEKVAIEDLSKKYDELDLIEESEIPKHPLFQKHLRIEGTISYKPGNKDSQYDSPERITLEYEDRNDENNTWTLNADIESLKREERFFVREHCASLFEACQGEFFGVIDSVHIGQLQYLGLRIEYLKIRPREPNVQVKSEYGPSKLLK